ncbi:hypothetical protein BGZ83_004571 [Gryganskiella cystojenkinii]|nr:hypothetical protein BGZ83_004571 [Gryganskiella cystojenkinii]
MSRDTSQKADLDFEQMMGELAAMKTDLANRQANRVGSRPTTPRVPGAAVGVDGTSEPRRTRLRRAVTEPRAEIPTDDSVRDLSVSTPHPALPVPSSPVITRSATLASNLRDNANNRDNDQNQNQSQQVVDQSQQQQPQQSQHPLDDQKGNDRYQYDYPSSSSSSSRTLVTAAHLQSQNSGMGAQPSTSNDNAANITDSNTNLSRSESRRSVTQGAPLPPKSAQRSRSISNNSGRLSQTISIENGDMIYRNQHDGAGSPLQDSFSSNLNQPIPPRKFLRPYPSSPSLGSANGQLAPASPRLPARSNSRSVKTSPPGGSPSSSNAIESVPQSPALNGASAPVIPPRSRSASRSLSRSNTLNRSETTAEQHNAHVTPAISEDYEGHRTLQQVREEDTSTAVPEETQTSRTTDVPTAEPGHMRKKSSSNVLRPVDENGETSAAHALAPSLLPAEPIPSPGERRPQRTPTSEENYFDGRPAIRKQKSADPAAMYRQHSQDPSMMREHATSISRHASERRPTRERNQSNPGVPGFPGRDGGGRSREPTHEMPLSQERGRVQASEENSSKGGMFSWVRSRSKSRDAPTRPTYDTSVPVPEQPTYTEYNPALIPSRSASSARGKSLPRKPSNQDFQARNDQWPPFSQSDFNRGEGPESMLQQKSKSFPKPGGEHGATPFGSSLKVSTNMVHHENMVRGMGMGTTPIAPSVLLTPQPSVPVTSPSASPYSSPSNGTARGVALAMMKEDGSPSSSELQMQQRQQQLQQAQMLHIQQQQHRLATSPPQTPTSPRHQMFNGPPGPLSPSIGTGPGAGIGAGAAPVTQKLVATRIYIQTETDFKSLNLAPNSTALDALHMLQQRGCFGEPGDGRYHDRWTIFEYSKEFMIERPLRDFEVILDVIKTWEADKDNKMICKSFPVRNELSASEVVRLVGPVGQASFVRPQGMVYLETKKSKWEKRYLHATDTAVYHAKDSKGSGEKMLCLLKNFDVYAVQVPRKKAPTKFGFALKSSDKIHLFETPEDDYIHYVCLESGESLREWLAGLRAAKGVFMYHANPEMIREGQKHATELLAATSGEGNRRGNLTEEQVSMAEAKLAGWGVSLNNSRNR